METGRILIEGGLVAGGDDGWRERHLPRQDVLLEGDRIIEIGPQLTAPGAQTIDARGCVVMPGLVNAHFHSSELLVRGRYDGLAFDHWGLYVYPFLYLPRWPQRLIYLRTALAGVELVQQGVTTVTDDVAAEVSGQALDTLESVFRAYSDVGLRANCSGNVMDRSQEQSWPFAEAVPAWVREQVAAQTFPSVAEYRDFCREAIRRFHRPDGSSRFVLAPVAPQWCSEELMAAAAEIAASNGLNLHTHLLETRAQALASSTWQGGGFVRYLLGLGALHTRTTLAHAVWLSEDDMEVVAGAGASVVHNPVANLRLGVGVAPVKSMLVHGINVALGTDGLAIHDSPSILEAARTAALVSRSRSELPEEWLQPGELLRAATVGGARSALLSDQVGTLSVGRKADILVVDVSSASVGAGADVRNELVFGLDASHLRTVLVDGRVVVKNGRVMTVLEEALRDELREYLPLIEEEQRRVEEAHRHLAPFLDAMHRITAASTP
jgi:5-methylthioadenosine/S-adenosylhomocysteine deaminase